MLRCCAVKGDWEVGRDVVGRGWLAMNVFVYFHAKWGYPTLTDLRALRPQDLALFLGIVLT